MKMMAMTVIVPIVAIVVAVQMIAVTTTLVLWFDASRDGDGGALLARICDGANANEDEHGRDGQTMIEILTVVVTLMMMLLMTMVTC